MSDAIAGPAVSTVTHFDTEVPVFGHMLVGETDDIRKILGADMSATRKDLETFAIMARWRTSATPDVDAWLRMPFDEVAFTRDLRRLLAPFARAQKALMYETMMANAEHLNAEQLKEQVAMLEGVLVKMREMTREAEQGQ